MTDWYLDRIVSFDWAEGVPATREDWIAQDGGFFLYPPAAGAEPVYVSPGDYGAALQSGLALLSALVSLVPVVGDAKDLVQLFTGKDLFTGERLSWLDRALGLLGPLGSGLDLAREGVAVLDGYRALAMTGDAHAAFALLEASARGGVAVTATVLQTTDLVLDGTAAAQGAGAAAYATAEALVRAADALRDGADPDALDWTEATDAVLRVGVADADRVAAALDAQHPLAPGTADDVRGVVVRAFVRQAQADGLLPERLEVVPAPAEGGDPAAIVDVWDPRTGTAWDLDGGGSDALVGTTLTTSAGEPVVVTRVLAVPTPS